MIFPAVEKSLSHGTLVAFMPNYSLLAWITVAVCSHSLFTKLTDLIFLVPIDLMDKCPSLDKFYFSFPLDEDLEAEISIL